MRQQPGFSSAQLEGLEPRWLLSKPAPALKFGAATFYFNDVAGDVSGGSGGSEFQNLVLRNAGSLPIAFPKHGMFIGGPNADAFVFTGKQALEYSPAIRTIFGRSGIPGIFARSSVAHFTDSVLPQMRLTVQ